MNELKNSAGWRDHFRHVIYNPDGWDRKNFKESWAELITEEEYLRRYGLSTVLMRPDPEDT